MNTILEAKAMATLDWKPPEHAKVWNLSDEHFCEVVRWIDAGINYKKVRALMAKELKLPPGKIPSGNTAVSEFWSRLRPHFLVARRRAASAETKLVSAEAERDPGKFDSATIEELKRLAFDLASSNADPKSVKGIFSLVLKARDQDIKVDQGKFEVEKFRFDATTAAIKHAKEIKSIVSDKSLTAAEQMEKVQLKLFGLPPESMKDKA